MRITYLYNSGFLIETENTAVITDYYTFDDGLITGERLKRFKHVYFLVSHHHPDHYSKKIFDVCENAKYILSKDVWAKNRNAVHLKRGECFKDEVLFVRAYNSTDIGVSFYLELENKKIFFAGDLNLWHWRGEQPAFKEKAAKDAFLKTLDEIASFHKEFDAAFFPVDPRMKTDCDEGALMFLERFKVKLFIPMHFREAYYAPKEFSKKNPGKTFVIKAPGDFCEA